MGSNPIEVNKTGRITIRPVSDFGMFRCYFHAANLQEMEWVLAITTMSNEERGDYSSGMMNEIRQEYRNG